MSRKTFEFPDPIPSALNVVLRSDVSPAVEARQEVELFQTRPPAFGFDLHLRAFTFRIERLAMARAPSKTFCGRSNLDPTWTPVLYLRESDMTRTKNRYKNAKVVMLRGNYDSRSTPGTWTLQSAPQTMGHDPLKKNSYKSTHCTCYLQTPGRNSRPNHVGPWIFKWTGPARECV